MQLGQEAEGALMKALEGKELDERRIVLIDAGSIIHPAYHVLKGFSTSSGFPTGAIFGFTRTLLKLLREYPSRYVAVAFDAPGEKLRHRRYGEYKAHRPRMEDDLAVQIPRVKEICEAFGVPIFEEAGYEADDLIATLAGQARARGLEVLIVSGDKDLMQLVGEKIFVLKPAREPGGDLKLLDPKGVERYLGVPPEKIRDFLALVGDAVDNVPGVPGIGEVTARKLISEYGSLEEVLKNAESIGNKRARKALIEHKEKALLSYELVRLEAAPLPEGSVERCRLREPDRERIRGIFEELEFRSLLKELGLAEERPKPTYEIEYCLVQSEEELAKLCERLARAAEVSLDLETTSEDEMRAEIVGVALALEPYQGYYIPIGHRGISEQLPLAKVLAQLKPYLEGERPKIVGQNLKYDAKVLKRHGIEIKGISFDSMLAAYLLDPTSRKDLNELALRYLGHGVKSFKELGEQQMSLVSLEEAANYATADAEVVLRLKEAMLPRLREQELERLFYEVELPLIPVLVAMELKGILLDREVLHEQGKALEVMLERLREEIFQLAGEEFNPNSPKQVAYILFEKLKLPVIKKTKTGPSTDALVLEQLAPQHPLPEKLLAYRELEKLLSTYVRKLPEHIHPETGRIHTSFNQSVTATGRLSSSNPNLQNIPIRTELGGQIREAFVAPEGRVLIGADYSQIELRVMAHITGDEGLIEAFQRDEDIHRRTAATILGIPPEEVTPRQRDLAKRVNFGISYGMSAYGLAQWAKIPRKEAEDFIQSYFENYPKVKAYMERIVKQAEERGYVETLLGRKRYFPGRLDSRSQREAINAPIQGCLPYETRILTSGGYIRIGELYEMKPKGLLVWTGRSFAPFKVLDRGPCELAELELENGHILRCDVRHKVLVMTEEGYLWKSYPQLEIGDRICLTLPQEIEFGNELQISYKYRPRAHNGKSLKVTTIDERFFYWLGFYYGDGWIAHRPEDHRWSLTYAIGSKARSFALEEKVAECASYFRGFGLNPKVRSSSKCKAEVIIHSRGLIEFLDLLGIETQAKAATKRIPEFIFRSPIRFRKAFLRGLLDADGHAGSNGASNPGLHLCQRELLEDLWLLFRTIGVEGKIRGPYSYRGCTSYRLDLVGGMLQRSLGFSGRSQINIPSMNAPRFLIEEFLRRVSSKRLTHHSHRVIYSRLRHGGTTSIYTLAEMLRAAGSTLPIPLYSWSRLHAKRSLGVVEPTFTLAVDDDLHSFDSEGIISKNTAADIMKLAMIRVHEKIESGALKADMLLQIHDELIFEADEDQAKEAAKLIKETMEGVIELRVPLKVDVKVGRSWGEI